MFWGKNMSNNGVFLIIVCTFTTHRWRHAIYARHIEITKRYARLANGNVRNFY